jgi:hypothetical protein
VLSAGQRHDSIAFEAVLAGVRITRHGKGRPRTRPDRVLADKVYSVKSIRQPTQARDQGDHPQPSDQIAHRTRRGSRGGRPPAFDKNA